MPSESSFVPKRKRLCLPLLSSYKWQRLEGCGTGWGDAVLLSSGEDMSTTFLLRDLVLYPYLDHTCPVGLVLVEGTMNP